MTLYDWLKSAQTQLEQAGISSARLDSELLAAYCLERDRAWLLAHRDYELKANELAQMDDLLARRTEREPLVHLTGRREFFGLEFIITPDVLTPRPETEPMIEWAAKYTPQNGRVIDIGTGSGALAIALLDRRPDLALVGTDVTPESLAVAQRNAQEHDAAIELILSNLWEHISGRFETVITNLPYLRDDADLIPEVQHEPSIALFGGADGLELYRRFLAGIIDHLPPGGYLFTESDPWQHEALTAEAAKYSLMPIEEDYFILGFQRTR